MKLVVGNTSMFDFDKLNDDGGLVFDVEQYYTDTHGFKYIAKNEEFNIVVAYRNKEDFDEELNDEIMFAMDFYIPLNESEYTPDVIILKEFLDKCMTEFKK